MTEIHGQDGASLGWDGVLTFIPPTSAEGPGFALPVGAGPGEAATIVRVRGSWAAQVRRAQVVRLAFDEYLVLDGGGEVVARAEGLRPDVLASSSVEFLAVIAGLGYREDVLTGWRDLDERYPMLLPGGGRAQALTSLGTSFALLVLAVCAGFTSLVGVVVAHSWLSLVGAFAMIGVVVFETSCLRALWPPLRARR